MTGPLSATRIRSHGMVLLLAILSGLAVASCTEPLRQFNESLREHQPITEYEYTLNGRKYFFTTERTTYQEVIRRVGTPDLLSLSTKLGENGDGTKFIIYRTIDEDSGRTHQERETGKPSSSQPETVRITDVKFLFSREERLVAAELLDLSNDREALADWERRRRQKDRMKTNP